MPDERDVFEKFVIEKGIHRIEPVVIYAPTHDDGSCWEAAWQEAQRLWSEGYEARYTEGTVWRTHDGEDQRVRAHAWVEFEGGWIEVDGKRFELPEGFCIIERTRGYGGAAAYLGVQIDSTPGGAIDRMTAHWGHERASIFETMIVTQYPELLREGVR